MSQRPWFPFYPGDFYQDCAHLSLEEQGAYIRLLSHAWTHDGLIPAENKLRARILGVHHHRAGLLWGVIAPYWISYPQGYRNKRLDAEMAKLLEVSEKRAAAAEKRWNANANASAYTPTSTSTEDPISTSLHTPKASKGGRKKKETGPDFQRWYSGYPRKVSKANAEKAWRNLPVADREAAIDALEWWPFADDRQFIPHPATWLNNRRWEDDRNEKRRSNGHARPETPYERIMRVNSDDAPARDAPGATIEGTAETVDTNGPDLRFDPLGERVWNRPK